MIQIDFAAVQAGTKSLAEQTKGLTLTDLQTSTKELFDALQSLITGASDQAMVFVPHDPAATAGDEKGWSIGHVVAHLTSSVEEICALTAHQARGVELDGQFRLRYETPWENIKTVEQVKARLTESRRMALAFLDAWPDVPNLQREITFVPVFGPLNAIGLCALGIFHGQLHRQQIEETLSQYAQQA
ncbi:MAG TPA: DinB family protein [Ktedonobacteraceae bacterium]|nr:DinB family protein [Ktedonobacteraceae bacterium]